VGFKVSLPFALLILSFSREILYVLFDSVEATQALRILAVGMFFYSMYYLISSCLQGLGRPRIPMYILSSCAFLDIILCFILIPSYSVEGAALATSTSMFVAFLLAFLYSRPNKIPKVLNIASVIPLLLFERCVGILDGKIMTVAVYMVAGLIYFYVYNRLNGVLDVVFND